MIPTHRACCHRSLWLLGALLWFRSGLAFAGSVTAELERTEMVAPGSTTLSVIISGSKDADPVIPTVPGLAIERRGVSQSMSYINGERHSETQITYEVLVEAPGEYTIPSIVAEVDGKQESALPLRLKVTGSASGANAPKAQGGSVPDPQGAAGGAPKSKPDGKNRGEQTAGVFIERECDRGEVFVGEQLLCTIRIYHPGNLAGGQLVSASAAEFRRFRIEGERKFQKIIGNRRYQGIELKEVVVPTKAGDLAIPPFGIDARVLVTSHRNNPLDKFFDRFGGGVFNFDMGFTEEQQVTVQSPTSPLKVKPLPDRNRPAGFSGLVGSYELTAQLSSHQVQAGETVTVTIVLKGTGVSDMAADPQVNLSEWGKVYPDKPDYKEDLSSQKGVESTRTYKFALVPTKVGTHSLGAIKIAAFHPKLDDYVTLSADLGNLIVDPGKAEAAPLVVSSPGAGGGAKEEVKTLAKVLLPPHEHYGVDQHSLTTMDLLAAPLVGGAPLAAAALSFAISQWRRRRRQDPSVARRSQAEGRCQASLSRARETVQQGRVSEGLTHGYAAIKDYLGDRLGRQGGAFAAGEIHDALESLGAGESLRDDLKGLVAKLEAATFAGRLPESEQALRWLNALGDGVRRLDEVDHD